MVSYLAYLNFINLPVCKSYAVNKRAKAFPCWTGPLLHGVLYAVMLKIVKSNDNVLSYTCVNFNDCLTGGQLHYDWDMIIVTRLNYILTSATTPSSHCDLDHSSHNACLVHNPLSRTSPHLQRGVMCCVARTFQSCNVAVNIIL